MNVHFGLYKDGRQTAAEAIKQGTDLECDSVFSKNLLNATESGLVTASDLRKNVGRIFLMFMKLGMFDRSVFRPPFALSGTFTLF